MQPARPRSQEASRVRVRVGVRVRVNLRVLVHRKRFGGAVHGGGGGEDQVLTVVLFHHVQKVEGAWQGRVRVRAKVRVRFRCGLGYLHRLVAVEVLAQQLAHGAVEVVLGAVPVWVRNVVSTKVRRC